MFAEHTECIKEIVFILGELISVSVNAHDRDAISSGHNFNCVPQSMAKITYAPSSLRSVTHPEQFWQCTECVFFVY